MVISLQKLDGYFRGHHTSLEALQRSFRDAGQQGGNCENTYLRFRPSEGLKNLRVQRRETRDARLRKSLTFTIRKNHRHEVRVWKIERLNAQLGHAKNWRTLRSMQFATKRLRQQQTPQPNAFADMLHCWVKFLQEIQTGRAAQPI